MIGRGLKAKRQALEQLMGLTGRHQLVLGEPALLLHGFAREQVTAARGTSHEFPGRGHLESLGYGLLGLLHEDKETVSKWVGPGVVKRDFGAISGAE